MARTDLRATVRSSKLPLNQVGSVSTEMAAAPPLVYACKRQTICEPRRILTAVRKAAVREVVAAKKVIAAKKVAVK